MADCVLDANVLVAAIDSADSQHSRARALLDQLKRQNVELCIVDVLVGEAVSVLARRFRERKRAAELPAMLAAFRKWLPPGSITWVAAEAQRLHDQILDIVSATDGRLNFNDALLVLLQQEGRLGPLATFDTGFDEIKGIERIAEEKAQP